MLGFVIVCCLLFVVAVAVAWCCFVFDLLLVLFFFYDIICCLLLFVVIFQTNNILNELIKIALMFCWLFAPVYANVCFFFILELFFLFVCMFVCWFFFCLFFCFIWFCSSFAYSLLSSVIVCWTYLRMPFICAFSAYCLCNYLIIRFSIFFFFVFDSACLICFFCFEDCW